MDKFSKGSFVNTQTPKLASSRRVEINSVNPNIFFDFFKDSRRMIELPTRPSPAKRVTEKLFFKARTLAKALRDNNNQIILL